ncbi:FAD-binding oxidoreductase [Agrobacterium tumefaciens]|uniref:FAD-binding oxidoreductase n=1 Tax=Agrobacterium tumefaciens TaxID=358 RepID=UPI0021D265B8|nr:FAD-binding oxidoreductase [Agrobacterium tumefaciens]UXS03144.1 FAD-binding oxidoreductase [Agrobacterium tumefaciens]
MVDYAKIKQELEGIAVEDNPALVRQKSRDFYWYSPVLKAQLDNVIGDLIVTPTSEEEVIRILKVAFAHGAPVTPRGTGTGNYGQAMPLSGGIVLNMAGMNKIKEIKPGRVICEPGIVIAELDKQTKAHSGQELRFHPSTKQTATIGGFIAGGSGGVGSITWGGLRDLGNILRLRVVTMEAEPRVLDLTAWDLQKVSHAYGTNGIITEVEMPLATAYDWVDVIVGYDDYMDAVKFADALAHKNGILLKEIAPIAAPIPFDYFNRHKPWLKEGQSVVVLMVAPHSIEPFVAFTERMKGDIRFRSDTVESMKGIPHAYELAWNHTTLRALKIDPSWTYLQVQYPGPDHVEKVRKMTEIFGDEVIGHLEFIKFDGHIQCSGLPLVRYTTEERLEEIIRIHEQNGCPIFNPHRYTLEEGGMKQTDKVQLAFKKETDPKGLLNPGKMIAWENPNFDFKAGTNYLFPGLSAFAEAQEA